MVTEAPQFSLRDCLHFSPLKLEGRLSRRLFIIYQILSLLEAAHAQGLAWGGLSQLDLYLDEKLWVQTILPPLWSALEIPTTNNRNTETCKERCDTVKPQTESFSMTDDLLPPTDWTLAELVQAWVFGRISNLSYLLALNRLAGRRFGDPNHHPMVPWVVDFTSEHAGWRDLRRTKYRLAKGDSQLDVQFESSCCDHVVPHGTANCHMGIPPLSTLATPMPSGSGLAHTPHHISAVLSDITYYTYKARR